MKKPVTFVAMLMATVLIVYLIFPDLIDYMNLDTIKMYHDRWLAFYLGHRGRVVTYFILFNIFMAMLPVPGISMISFLGGSIFGFLPGMFYSSIATAVGNLGGYFLGRFFLMDWVLSRYGHKARIFNESWQKEGAMALFSARLFPLIPSFVANYVMGASSLNWWTFFWVSWVGRIPMVVVYTYAGVKMSTITSPADILSLPVLSAFILLAVLPWIFKAFRRHS